MNCRHKNVSTTKAFRKFIDVLETDYNWIKEKLDDELQAQECKYRHRTSTTKAFRKFIGVLETDYNWIKEKLDDELQAQECKYN